MSMTSTQAAVKSSTSGSVKSPGAEGITSNIATDLKLRIERICADFIESRADVDEGAGAAQAALHQAQQERLWNAACWRDYQLAVAERTFTSESTQIESEFAAEALQLREAMVGALLEQRQALQEERDRLVALQAAAADISAAAPAQEQQEDSQPAASNTGRAKRNLRNTTGAAVGKKEEASAKASSSLPIPGTTVPKRRAQAVGALVLGMATLLSEHEIYEDLNAISRASGDDGAGRRNAPRAQAKTTASKKRVAAADEPLAASPAKSAATSSRRGAASALKDLSAPADETLSPAEDDEEEARSRATSSRRRSLNPPSEKAASFSSHKRKNSAEDRDISIDQASGAFYYCGCKYFKGAPFDMSFGRDLSKTFPVILVQASGSEIQVKKVADGSKIKVQLEELTSGSVMLLASQ